MNEATQQSSNELNNRQKNSKKTIVVVALVTALCTAGAMAGGYLLFLKHKKTRSVMPVAVASQVSFTIFLPNQSAYAFLSKNITYDITSKVLTINATKNGVTYTLNEQATPDTITDIPQYYDKLVESMNQYKQFESQNGQVALTRPKELKGGQTAVLKEKGTLLFVRPSAEVSEDDWRQFFNGLYIAK